MSPTSTRQSDSSEQRGEHRRITLDHPDLPHVDVRLRRGPRTRHVRIHVDEAGAITASVPARFSAPRLDPVVRERADWIYGVLQRVAHARRSTEVDLERGDPVPWAGGWLATRLLRVAGSRRMGGELHPEDALTGLPTLELRVRAGDDPHQVLLGWYRRAAREVFQHRVAEWSGRLGLAERTGRVSVREQRTRWGSCTHRGDLSFNWRLVLAPAWVLDSIVVHELCHIEELNHSARFWALVDERYPQHREASAWLREHGPALRVSRATTAGPRAAAVERSNVGPSPAAPSSWQRGTGGAAPEPGGNQITLF